MSNFKQNILKKMIEDEPPLLHSYRVFLSHPIEGHMNLFDLIEKSNIPVKEMIEHLMESGNILQNIHESGYLHNDFTLEHVMFDLKKKKISLTELELKTSIENAKKGIKQFHGNPGYINPLWLMGARRDYIRSGKVKYSIKNDTYAFLHASDLLLQQACLRANNQNSFNRLRSARAQIHTWKDQPFEQLPTLQHILGFLKQLKTDPKQSLAHLSALDLHKQKRLR